jgi:hypothetical protein
LKPDNEPSARRAPTRQASRVRALAICLATSSSLAFRKTKTLQKPSKNIKKCNILAPGNLVKWHINHVLVSRDSEKVKEQLHNTHKKQGQLQQITELQRKEIKKIEGVMSEAEVVRG